MDASIYEQLSSYCAYQERCVNDVRQKLYKLKVLKEDYGDYIDKLQQQNFLNEDRFVKYFVSSHQKKKWGKSKMKAALAGKRIHEAIIKKYLDNIDTEDYDAQIKEIAAKKWKSVKGATLRDRKTKLLRFLLGKGYEMSKAIAAIKELEP